MEGVSPVSSVSAPELQFPVTSLFSTIPPDWALYCTLYFTMRPLTSLHGERPLHWTEMTVELRAAADTLPGAAALPVFRELATIEVAIIGNL